MSSYSIPTVVSRDGRGGHAMDVYSHLLAERIISVRTPVDSDVANVLV